MNDQQHSEMMRSLTLEESSLSQVKDSGGPETKYRLKAVFDVQFWSVGVSFGPVYLDVEPNEFYHQGGGEQHPRVEDEVRIWTDDGEEHTILERESVGSAKVVVEMERYVKPEKLEEFHGRGGVPIEFSLDIRHDRGAGQWQTVMFAVEHDGLTGGL